MDVRIVEKWKRKLSGEFENDYFKHLAGFVREEYSKNTVYPPAPLIFNAFDSCPFDRVKAVIIGQDPYHGPGQAHGLCFSVKDNVDYPPSLKNIFREIKEDIDISCHASGNLERWAKQGVLLLNDTLTVRAHAPGSHQKKGWEIFTVEVIRIIAEEKENVVFFLWGSYARKKGVGIDREIHLVL
ncbi:MAG: uracil-DNA glycosylase, partial [Spirochaetales bacterium]|nr:uracil-DNA glycosylase [Spirochaetales bacterium]